MACQPHHAYVLVWRVDRSSVLQFSVSILFSCLLFSCFLLFALNSTTHILQHGDRKLTCQSPYSRRAFRNVRPQIKSSNFPSAFLFSVLKMERDLSVTHRQFLTSNTSLLGSVSDLSHLVSFTRQCQCLAVYSLCSWQFYPVPCCQIISPAKPVFSEL